jgi:hypothetical protein
MHVLQTRKGNKMNKKMKKYIFNETRCKCWKNKTKGTSTYNEDNRLPNLFIKDVEPISSRLSKGDLLNRCLKGMTQNPNDAANGMFWPRSP